MDDDDWVGAFDSAQGDPASRAVVGDDNVAQAQVERGHGSNAKSHGYAFRPVVEECRSGGKSRGLGAVNVPPTSSRLSEAFHKGVRGASPGPVEVGNFQIRVNITVGC